jgi:hypothetical protein
MWYMRPRWLILLVIFAILTPASFLVAATRFTMISFTATGFTPAGAPVDPVTGTFRFEFDESLLTAGTGTVGSVASPLMPTFVDVNYDSFTTANVGAVLGFLSGDLDSLILGGTVNGINSVTGNDGTDDFSTAGFILDYATAGTSHLFFNDDADFDFEYETRVSDS